MLPTLSDNDNIRPASGVGAILLRTYVANRDLVYPGGLARYTSCSYRNQYEIKLNPKKYIVY